MQPKGNELRVLAQWCDVLYQAVGNMATIYPEGTKPQPCDNEEKLERKIAKMLGG